MGVILILISWLVSCHGQFAAELQGNENACHGEGNFRCLDGACIIQDKYCDGEVDCMDGSDENFCPKQPAHPNLCNSTSHFICTDRMCIPNPWFCNKVPDCDDRSDNSTCTRNNTCKGFLCDKNKCISNLWTCDGFYDCDDKTDEAQGHCKFSRRDQKEFMSMFQCRGIHSRPDSPLRKFYQCIDSSFCLPQYMMCDGMVECRDGSDEGEFCKNWHTVCSSSPCPSNTHCVPDRDGYTCVCPNMSMQKYNATTNSCEDVDECASPMPYCSQICVNHPSGFKCQCEPGYTMGDTRVLCRALGPEAKMFFSTKNEIGYITLKSQKIVSVAGIKQGRGVAYDGRYIYWVEAAQGHQAIMRALLYSVEETKEVVVGIGLKDPEDVAVDWLQGHIYFTDAERSIISICETDGSICTILPTRTKRPRSIALDVKHGQMYWADFFSRPVIMSAGMDGSHSQVLVDSLSAFATSLTVDAPSGRLYYVDHNSIQAVKLDTKQHYVIFKNPFHHPYAIAVFENTVYWSDWISYSIQTFEKVLDNGETRRQLVAMKDPVIDMHIYHPVLMAKTKNPCSKHRCSHLCLVSSSTTYSCACPEGMELENFTCHYKDSFRPQYLVVGAGSAFSRVQYNSLGNPETHATFLNIGRVQAMAYDSVRDALYVYDDEHQSISSINMTDFTLGLIHHVIKGFVNVVDMDYDFASDSLYILDAGKPSVEVVSLRTQQRAMVYRFRNLEIPISFCLMPEYGKMLVAIRESEYSSNIYIESIGLDGSGRKHLNTTDLTGPRIRLRYALNTDSVYLADEGNNVIERMSPEGSNHEHFRDLITSIADVSVTDTYVFWTDRRTPRLFWADVSDVANVTNTIRRIELTIFPNNTQLHIQASSPPPNPNSTLWDHPCLTNNTCSHVCVQTPHILSNSSEPSQMGYKCLCPTSLLPVNGNCEMLVTCKFDQEFHCYDSHKCIMRNKTCDGNKDCEFGEDEEDCDRNEPIVHRSKQCPPDHVLCNGKCEHKKFICKPKKGIIEHFLMCKPNQFNCVNTTICIERPLVCDKTGDCPGETDEDPSMCKTFTCKDSEFRCSVGSCIPGQFKCDGEEDCPDGSDEANCENPTCPIDQYQCENKQCVNAIRVCDGVTDCEDKSDEKDCDKTIIKESEDILPHCAEKEFYCELNTSICLPNTARCNKKADCPGGTDELNCDDICAPRGQFLCKQQLKCVPKQKVCDGKEQCLDGSDEAAEACAMVNRTSSVYPPSESQVCPGYLCEIGKCLEWTQVCDGTVDCFDSSDEHGQCDDTCQNDTCEFACQPTPKGPRCDCGPGMRLRTDNRTCVDVDECAGDVCSQHCNNIPGSFLCSCYQGYSLRPDRQNCKATQGVMSLVWASQKNIMSLKATRRPVVEYTDENGNMFYDVDVDVRRSRTFVSLPHAKKLLALEEDGSTALVWNIGDPTNVAVDWVTGNVYFVSEEHIRACNVDTSKCAVLHKLPLTRGAKLTALVVDPGSRRMFYCVTRDAESVVYAASLAGRQVVDLATRGNCTGLAVDSFGRQLYVAETGPAQIVRMDFDGDKHQKVLYGHSHLEAPRDLAIFEDWIYFLVENSHTLNRCRLSGEKSCRPFNREMLNASAFAIRHNSVQRDDLTNVCAGYACSNLCVLGETGPQCICDNGVVSYNGECPKTGAQFKPQFYYHEIGKRTNKIVILAIAAIGACIGCVACRKYRIYSTNCLNDRNVRNVFRNQYRDGEPRLEPIIRHPNTGFVLVLDTSPTEVSPVDSEVGIPHNPLLRLQRTSDDEVLSDDSDVIYPPTSSKRDQIRSSEDESPSDDKNVGFADRPSTSAAVPLDVFGQPYLPGEVPDSSSGEEIELQERDSKGT